MVPEDNEIWIFLLNFIEILDLILLPDFDDNDIIKLEKCIIYHNTKYVELFNDSLKPKHHFLTHYCNIIKKKWSIKYLWTYNFESKHRQLKSYTKNINSRINVPLSLGIKFCLNFTEFIMNFNIDNLNIYKSLSKGYSITSSEYYQHIKILFSDELLLNDSISFDKISFYGTEYNIENLLIIYSDNKPHIFLIKQIVCINKITIFLFCQHIDVKYKKHFASYEIITTAKNENYIFKNINEFNSPPVHTYTLPTNEKVVRLKNYL